MGCMCMECKYSEVLSDNHDCLLRVCVCRESEYFLHTVSTAFGECDFGIVDDEEDNEKGGEG
jgi:hypothetical protein